MNQTYILLESSVMKDGTMPTGASVYENKTRNEIDSIFYSVVSSKYADTNVISSIIKVFDMLGNEVEGKYVSKEDLTEDSQEEQTESEELADDDVENEPA